MDWLLGILICAVAGYFCYDNYLKRGGLIFMLCSLAILLVLGSYVLALALGSTRITLEALLIAALVGTVFLVVRWGVYPLPKDYRRLAVTLASETLWAREKDPSRYGLSGMFHDHCENRRINGKRNDGPWDWNDVETFLIEGPAQSSQASASKRVARRRLKERGWGTSKQQPETVTSL